MWKSKPKVAEQDEPFDEWRLRTPIAAGDYFDLNGFVHGRVDQSEARRFVIALRDGLRSAGYEPELTLTRKTNVVER